MTLESTKNIKDVSSIFFGVLAFVYLIAWLLLANNVIPEIAKVLFDFLDLPVYLTGGTLLSSRLILSLSLTDTEDAPKAWAIWILVFAILSGLMILNLFAAN